MTVVDDILVETFRASLPDVHNREMWVNETVLEYRRLELLREKGFTLRPEHGSLMEKLLDLEPCAQAGLDSRHGQEAYEELFGHSPTYCWSTPISDLYLRLATGSSGPGSAWMSNHA